MESAAQQGTDEDFLGSPSLMDKPLDRQALFSPVAYMRSFNYTSLSWTLIRTQNLGEDVTIF